MTGSELGVLAAAAMAAVGLATWLIRSLAKHAMDRDLAKATARLEANSAAEIEKLRHDLQVVAREHEHVHANLVSRRADAIQDLYTRLIDYLAAAESYTSAAEFAGEPSKDEKQQTFAKAAEALWPWFVRNRILLPESVCEAIEKLYRTVSGATRKFSFWRQATKASSKSFEKEMEAWEKAEQVISDQVPPLLREIENEFRSLLGVVAGASALD